MAPNGEVERVAWSRARGGGREFLAASLDAFGDQRFERAHGLARGRTVRWPKGLDRLVGAGSRRVAANEGPFDRAEVVEGGGVRDRPVDRRPSGIQD